MAAPKRLLDKRLVNALYKEAALDSTTGKLMGAAGKFGLRAAEKLMGGLWVGGMAYLTPQAVEFHANALNKLVQTPGSIEPVVFPLAGIEDVAYKGATVTHIIELVSGGRTLSIRGYNMRAFHAAICQAMDADRQASP